MIPVKKGCSTCPFLGRSVVPPSGDVSKAKVIIIGQAPGREEIPAMRPFVGNAGRLLWKEFETLGIHRSDCYVTNVAKCRPDPKPEGGDEAPPTTVRKHCSVQFEEEWKAVKARKIIIVLFGNPATSHFLGRAGSTVRARVITHKGNDYYPLWHPAFLTRKEGAIPVWRRHLSILPSLMKKVKAHKTIKYDVITSPIVFEECVGYFLACKEFAFDIETTTKRPTDAGARILTMSISDGVRTSVVDLEKLGNSVDAHLKRLLVSKPGKIAQNAKFELVWMAIKKHFLVQPIVFDPSIAQYLIAEGTGAGVALKQMVWTYMPEFGGYDSGIDKDNMAGMDRKKVYEYNAIDSYVTAKLTDILRPLIEKGGFSYVMNSVMLPGIFPVTEMEVSGLKVDVPGMDKQKLVLEDMLKKTHAAVLKLPAVKKVEDFSITSTPALRRLFYGELGYRITARTAKSKVPALTKDMIERWAVDGNTEAVMLQTYKKTRKVLKTYYENYKKMITRRGYLHPVYNMTISKGGRLSSGSPNIHNVPVPVRHIFVSRFPGGVILQADFKQIELRVIAFLANDEKMLDIFRSGKDPHRAVAAEIFNVPYEDVTKEQRSAGKNIGFGMSYGMGPEYLADKERKSLAWAKKFHDNYFRKFYKIREWQQRQQAIAESGVAKRRSLFGRVRDMSAYSGMDRVKRFYNFPVQSAASDINLFAIGAIWEIMRSEKLKSRMIATVHDSLVVDCVKEEVERVKEIMVLVVASLDGIFDWMTAPMEIDLTTGKNWSEASG